MGRPFVLFLLLFFLLAPATAGTIPSGIVATLNLTNFTFAADFEADTFSARDYGIAINDSYLDVNATNSSVTINITEFTIDVHDFTANSSGASNPTNFTTKMRNQNVKYNLTADGLYLQDVLTDSSRNATWQYTLSMTPVRFVLRACTESWSYTQWSDCSGGSQSRTGADANSCGTAYNRSAVTQACSVSTGTSGGGGGGGGGSFSEGTPSQKSLAFSFQATTPILKILATVLYTLPEAQNITVSYPPSIPLSVPPTPGLAYSFMEISPNFNSSRYLTSAQIDFRVNKTWYSKNEIVPSSTALLRYDGRLWRSLPTLQTGEDPTTYSFSANTTSFSLFAIAGTRMLKVQPTLPAVAVATSPTSISATPTATQTQTSLPVSPAIQPPPSRAPLILLIVLALAVVLYLKKPKKPPVKMGASITVKGIVTSHGWNDFDVFDGTGFISVRYGNKSPPLARWVEVEGTFSRSGDQTYIAAKSVRQLG